MKANPRLRLNPTTVYDWAAADKYARNVVLTALEATARGYEYLGDAISLKRAYAARAAIAKLSRETSG